MAGEFRFRVQGVADLTQALRDLTPKLRVRALRNALAAGARIFRDDARRLAPVISASSSAVRRGWRKPGTLKRAIVVRTSKRDRRAGNVGVFVNVRPAKAGNRGAKNPNDPFYWRWVEFGWNHALASDGAGNIGKRARRRLLRTGAAKRTPGVAFLRRASDKHAEALRKIEQTLGPQIRKLNMSKAPAP